MITIVELPEFIRKAEKVLSPSRIRQHCYRLLSRLFQLDIPLKPGYTIDNSKSTDFDGE